MKNNKNSRQNILIILNGIIGEDPPLSGGDIRPLELAKYWEKKGFNIHILSSETAKKVCANFDIHPVYHIMPNLNSKSSKINYIIRAIQSLFFLPSSLKKITLKYVYSSNDTLFDVIPAFKLKLTDKKACWIALAHIIPPFPPWKRKNTAFMSSTLFFISERLSIWLANLFADKIFAVSENTFNQLHKIGMNRKKIHMVECGVNYKEIFTVAKSIRVKKYDAVFMKRLQRAKGVFDLVDIWKKVVKNKKEARLLVLGTGSIKDVKLLKTKVKSEGLQSNIILGGHIQQLNEKINKLAESRLFIHPSYEENWAMVIGEAMAAGLPVIAYDLPELRLIWKGNVEYIPQGDIKAFSKKIIYYLEHPDLRKRKQKENQAFVKKFDWKHIAERELSLIKKN